MVVKHHRKGKSEKGKSGREAKKGATGIAAAYITRTKALKRLQVSLKDFRRLCILKGVFPRDPKKKREGRDKTYYHAKDIAYLQHEPLLQHFRDLKTFLRKVHRARVAHDSTRVQQLTQHRPAFTLHHLLRERYPSFQLAVNDLDDALNLVSLFHHLPTTTLLRAFTPDYAQAISSLLHEWLLYVAHSHSLTKVFVSIKGIYYQADINAQPVTWLMPHQFTQHLPTDVDYRVMFTFAQWHVTLLRFVNFKLYHDARLHYPPAVNQQHWEQARGLTALTIQHKIDTPAPPTASPSPSPAAPTPSKGKRARPGPDAAQLQRKVDRVVSGLDAQPLSSPEADEAPTEAEEFNDVPSLPSSDPPNPATADYDRRRALFSACVFHLSREVPRLPLELTILAGGGQVRHDVGDGGEGVTHAVVDRPRVQGERWKGVHYVQPQWVFDSFNLRVLAPVSLYEVGRLCPPHLSPFVADEEGGYEPEQRRVQRGWVQGVADVAEAMREEKAAEEEGGREEEEVDEETRYEAEMELERRAQEQRDGDEEAEEVEAGDEGDEDDEGEVDEDSDDDEAEVVEDSEDEDEGEGEEEEVKAPARPPVAAAGKAKEKAAKVSEEAEAVELAKVMMGKKAARLYQRMQFGLAKKRAADDALRRKRDLAEQRASEQPRPQPHPQPSRPRGEADGAIRRWHGGRRGACEGEEEARRGPLSAGSHVHIAHCRRCIQRRMSTRRDECCGECSAPADHGSSHTLHTPSAPRCAPTPQQSLPDRSSNTGLASRAVSSYVHPPPRVTCNPHTRHVDAVMEPSTSS